jgi:two-component system sensor histidine kinase ChiS
LKNKSLKIVAIFLTIMVIAILPIRYFFYENSKVKAPLCENGFRDLSKWDFNKNGNVKLNGEWAFYPNVLLTPTDMSSKPLPQKLTITVPNRWLSEQTRHIISDKGIGTYRLKVKINKSIYMYGLKTTNIRSSSKIFVNGKEIGKSGNPAVSFKEGYVGNVVPLIAFFPSEADTLDIIIQVANLDYYNGGIIQSIYLGSEKKILDYNFKINILEMMGISFLLLSGIYYFGIYIKRSQDRRFLYISIVCMAYAYITATGNEKIFNKLFDFLPFMLVLKVKIAIICLSIIFVSLFIREMSRDFIPGHFMKVIVTILSINMGLILAAPIKLMPLLENIIGPLNSLVYVLIAVLLFKAIMGKKYGSLSKRSSIFFLYGIILIILSFLSSFLYFYSVINNYVIPLLVLFFLLIGIAALFVAQYLTAYADLESMSNKLIKADKLKNEFLINTSHEFKTPLHGIINIAQAILNQKEGNYTKKQEENLTYIISIATRLSSLVNDIIDFQSLQNKSLRLNKKNFDINGTVQAVIEVLKHMRKGEDIKLLNNIPVGEYYAYTDENRFKQIIVNLISNSLKYTEKGYVEIKANAIDSYLYISVEDTGIGVDEKAEKELFKGNMHTGEMNFTDNNSSGMGLSISKLLATNMGGDLYLKWSELDKGSNFVVKLPEADKDKRKETYRESGDKIHGLCQEFYASEAVAAQDEYNDKAATQKLKILIVDDEASNIKVLQEIFYERHYETLIAYNGFKALELIKSYKDISIVLLDVMMPGLSGYEVCKRIRQEYQLFELPILLLTVRNTPEDIATGLEAGANDFLIKPFNTKELKARVETLQKIKEAVGNAIKMETAFLQSQIKPHFLYNALSVIMSLCYSDGERAGSLLAELSNYLRCSFDINPHNSFISLKKEISHVKSYVELEKVRFGERLKVELHIEERALGYRIPALIIQPIVENAIRHGLMKRISGGRVEILAEIINSELKITIKDDGLGIPLEKLKILLDNSISTGSIGLKNVNRRLFNEYGQGLFIESREGEGTEVIINIPIKAMNREAGEDKL